MYLKMQQNNDKNLLLSLPVVKLIYRNVVHMFESILYKQYFNKIYPKKTVKLSKLTMTCSILQLDLNHLTNRCQINVSLPNGMYHFNFLSWNRICGNSRRPYTFCK